MRAFAPHPVRFSPRVILSLFVGILPVDAVLVTAAGAGMLAHACMEGFALTLALHRLDSGT